MPLRFLFRSFTLLLGMLYLSGVCELDAQECRQNYANESHEYVTTAPVVDVSAPAAQPDEVPDALPAQWVAPIPRLAFRPFAGSPASWAWVANPPPPVRRLYLRYAVLQI